MLPISKYGVTPNGVHLPENSNISYNPGYVQNGGFVNLGYSDHVTNSADYVKIAIQNQWNALLGGDLIMLIHFLIINLCKYFFIIY